MSVDFIVEHEFPEDLFHLPPSKRAHREFIQMEHLFAKVLIEEHTHLTDTWSYIWVIYNFSSHKAYKVLIGSQPRPPHFN